MEADTQDRSPDGRRRRFAVNAAAGAVANAIRAAIQLLSLPVMAHLVGPTEFGFYALALPTVSFFTVLADAGLGVSLAREEETSAVIWSTAFWVLLATGISLSILVSVWGFILADLSNQPRLAPLMAFLSVSFFFLTMSVLPAARLTRRGNLVISAWGDVSADIVGSITAITLASNGAGAWSLAAQFVLGFVVRFSIYNGFAFYKPLFVFNLAGLRSHLLAGGSIIGSRLAEFAARIIETLVYGRTFGPAALGTYTFANQVPRYITQAMHNPLWAALYAHALHEDAKSLATLHRQLCRLLGMVLLPVAFLLTASAPHLFALALGPRWAPAALVTQILMPTYALSAISTLSSAILMAKNRNAMVFWNVVASAFGRVVVVVAGIWTGALIVALGIGLVNILASLAMFAAPTRLTGNHATTMLRSLLAPSVASILAAATYWSLLNPGEPRWGQLTAGLTAGTMVYGLVMGLLEGSQIKSDLVMLKKIIIKHKKTYPSE